jgi:hypothetical protein
VKAPVLPENIQAAVSVLLGDRPYPDKTKVEKAARLINSFAKSVPGIVKTKRDAMGQLNISVSHSFPDVGISIEYLNGRVTGASRIKTTDTSNKDGDRKAVP